MARRRRGEGHEEHMDESWLIPYADLLTLLLALFIVLFAASNVDKQKYEAISSAFQSSIMSGGGLTYIPRPVSPSKEEEEGKTDLDQAELERLQLEAMQQTLQIYLEQSGLAAEVTTSIDARGLVISMNNALLFDSGSAQIKMEYRDILVQIGQTIDQLDNYIRVEGHTDIVPTNSDRYPTNWELSNDRAAKVVRLFQEVSGINPEKLMAVGYGEYKPVADNLTPEGREKNRRVDVILLNSRFDILEKHYSQ